ncbi:PREDICTED: uncharacterized protein LOC105139490 isoform X4 [Populus euphratica]|uniref:Uncharacterized protein LOC105139490 isoform X4 n=1 Tax=Populus euphratica TaxID=75702 RepID=A0AAJ6Y6M3_POPEU|nr:PREDICTED: uncharacterized protein LOC105139490 isoform X4 [Populus euphratica]
MEDGEMIFHGMKRKRLQALCKKHGILANKSNAEMAHLLTLTLKATENPITQGYGEVPNESDSTNVPKKSKNVKFRPDVEVREYEPSVYKGRKRSLVDSGKVNGSLPRARNRVQRTVERHVDKVVLPVVEKKRGRGGEKKGSVGVENVDFSDKPQPPAITKDGGAQLVKGGDNLSRRQLKSREVVIEKNVEGGEGDLVVSRKNLKRGISRKRGNSEGSALLDEVSLENVSANDDAKPANVPSRPRRSARKNVSASLLSVELGKSGIVGRTTRSRAKVENTSVADNKAQTFEVHDECQKVLQTEEPLKGIGSYALGRKSFVPQKGVAVEILTDEGVESGNGNRRSRRNARNKEGTSLSSGDFSKTEIVGRTTRSHSKLEENTSSLAANKSETIEIQDKCEKVLQDKELLKDLGRYTLRRKSMVLPKGVEVVTLPEEGLESVRDIRRSKRNMLKDTDSKSIMQVAISKRAKFGAQVAGNACAVESAVEVTKVNKEQNRAVQPGESLKAQGRNASRQKHVTAQKGKVESEGPEVKKETRKQSRHPYLKAVNKVEASVQSRGGIEKAAVPIGHLRRSRRNTVVSSSTLATDELGTVEAVGKVGQLKRKRNPMMEKDASAVVGECLVGKPSRQSTKRASKSDLVGYTFLDKTVEKKKQSISALPTMVEEAISTEEMRNQDTGLILPEATGDKYNFSLNRCEEVFKTSDKKGSLSKTSEMRRTSFFEVSALCPDIQEGLYTKFFLQETSSPTSISLTPVSACANQETLKNASQPAVLNEEANIVVGGMEKLDVDDPSCRSTDDGADSGLEKGLERKELGEDLRLESRDVNDCSTEVDRTFALEHGICDLENTGQNITANNNEYEEAPCEDRASPAAGEEMVSLSTEINLQENGDVLTKAAEEKQNLISEGNSGDVSQVSRGTRIHELLDGEGTCLSVPEQGTDGGENCSAATVPSQSATSIGKQRLSFSSGDSSVGRNRLHQDEKSTTKSNSSCKDGKHVLEEKEAASDALPQSSLKELQDKKEDNMAITRETEVTLHSDSDIVSNGVNASPMLSEELSCYNEMIAKINCSIDATVDASISKFHETVMDTNSGRGMDEESDVEQCETTGEESGCAVVTEHGDDSGCQKVSAKVNANADSCLVHLVSEGTKRFEGKTFDMMMGRSNDFRVSSKEMVNGTNMAREQCAHVVRKETANDALLAKLCDYSSGEEVAANLNGNADTSLTPAIYKELEISGRKNVGSGESTSKSTKGNNMWTDHETLPLGSDSNAGTFAQGMDEHLDEEKTAEMSGGDLCDHISRDGEAADKKPLMVTTERLDMSDTQNEGTPQRNSPSRPSDLCNRIGGAGEAVDKESLMVTAERLDMSNTEDEGTAQSSGPVGLGKQISDYGEFLKINDAGRSAFTDIASADCEDIGETSNVVMSTELEPGAEAGKFDNLKEGNALELERSASIASENHISMDVIAAFMKEDVEKVEDDSKLKHSNIDDEKKYSIFALQHVTSKGIAEHSVEELLHENKDNCNAVSKDASKNIEADEAGSVAIGGKICFEKIDDSNNWTKQKLFAESSSGTCGMGSFTDAVSVLHVFLSQVATDHIPPHLLTGSDASASFTNGELNLIQGKTEHDQVESDAEALKDNLISNDSEHTTKVNKNVEEISFTNWEANLIQVNGEQEQVEESDGEPLKDSLISNDAEHTVWVNKNVEILFTDREVNLILGNGEQHQVEESDGVALKDNSIINDPLDEHGAETSISNNTFDDAPQDLKVDNISHPEIQNTCETGLGAIDRVSSVTPSKMGILDEVGIGGTLQPVIPVEASPETAICTQQKTSLSCSKPEQNVSSEQLVFDDTYCSLTEITSVCSVVQKNGPVSCGRFVPQLYCKDMSNYRGEETTCNNRGSNHTEQGEFHREDYEVLIAQNVGSEEVTEALNDATTDTSLETTQSDPREVAIEQANEHPDEVNESALMNGLDCPPQNQQSCQRERESHAIETEATHCLHKLDVGVFSKEIVDFGNGIVTSPFKCQKGVDSPAGSSFSASQHHITENDAWELNLFFEENEQDENQTSDTRFLLTNLKNKDAGKVEENIVVTEQVTVQVADKQQGELGQVMDEKIEEAKHTFFTILDELNFEDSEGSKKQVCVPLEVDSIQECINCENHENKSVNTEHSYDSGEKEIWIDVAEVNACHDAVSPELRVECDPIYLKQHSNENLSGEDVGVTKDLSVDVSSKSDAPILDQSAEITNSAISKEIAVGDGQTRQMKLPSPQKTTSCAEDEESHSSDAKQLNTSMVKGKINKTGFVQATPRKMVTYTGMKENLASIKREQRDNLTAPNALLKRRALGNLRNN